MNKNIFNYNSKRQLHGYQERYWGNGKLWFKCFFHNGRQNGYEECYKWFGELEKIFNI